MDEIEPFSPPKNAASVTQDNQIIEACYKLSLNEKRLLLIGMSKIDPLAFPTGKASFEITAAEWNKLFPQDANPWRAMNRAASKMLTRYVTYHPRVGIKEMVSWFDAVRYYEGEGRIKVTLGMSITTRLQGMLTQFTKVNLLDVSKMNSFFSIRLYELVSQFRATGYRRISVEDFRFALNCVDSYKGVKELKRSVIIPSVKEVNEKADFELDCHDVKRGRRIVGFEFIVREKEQGDLFK
jgi:plasmid replication initiation protein